MIFRKTARVVAKLRRSFSYRAKVGKEPGTLLHTGDKKSTPTSILQIRYDRDFLEENVITSDNLPDIPVKTGLTNWYDIAGLDDLKVVERIGQVLDIPPMALEDALHIQHHPKLEEYSQGVSGEHSLFLIAKAISIANQKDGGLELNVEHVSFLLRANTVISIHEEKTAIFDVIRNRLQDRTNRLRMMGSDYLLYSLLDALVDNYLIVLESLSDEAMLLNAEVLSRPDEALLKRVHDLRHAFLVLRAHVAPLKDMLYSIVGYEYEEFSEKSLVYYRDIKDHLNHLLGEIAVQQEMLRGLFEVYTSLVNMKTNQVIIVLTVMTAIFIPLTFVTSIYGMNFHNMPELAWEYGYPSILFILFSIALITITYFQRSGLIDKSLFPLKPERDNSNKG